MYRYSSVLNKMVYVSNNQYKPSGHIYGVVKTVLDLSRIFDVIILAIDSKSDRIQNKKYKSNRKNDNDYYNLFSNLYEILTLSTYLSNVYYVKIQGYEADDIISSFINLDLNLSVMACDNDILQTNKPFRLFQNIYQGEIQNVNICEYIYNKYSIKLNFLPIWYKVIRGDKSDNIPAGCLRYPKLKLDKLLFDLKDTQNWEDFEKYIQNDEQLLKNLDLLKSNYNLVKPRYINKNLLILKKIISSQNEIYKLLNKFSFTSLIYKYKQKS